MFIRNATFLALGVACVSLCAPRVACSDLIKLKTGGEIRGRVDWTAGKSNPDEIKIETLSGAKVIVSRGEIQLVARRPLVIEDYEVRARKTPDTIDAQWELAEWCRERRLTIQRAGHLERILELDPQHRRAHLGLKHTKRDGVWMTLDESKKAQGLVKYKGKYVTPQQLELLEKSEVELEQERKWHKKVRLWKNWLSGSRPKKAQEGYEEIIQIKDPNAVSALSRFFHDDSNFQRRKLYLSVLAQIPGPNPVAPLVEQSLYDVNYELRYAALNSIGVDQYETAMPLYLRKLHDDLNQTVRRSGAALERVGNKSIVPQLIAALTTKHKYKVRIPDKSGTIGVRSDGNFSNGAGNTSLPPEIEGMLRTGQFPNGVIVNNPASNQLKRYKTVVITHEHQNAEVLSALQKLTGQSFAYNERTWRLWWLSQQNGATAVPTLP